VPRISYFYGITIAMFWDERDHQVVHFHAEYAGSRASIALDGTVLGGSLPPRALSFVREWASERQEQLLDDWQRARRHEPLAPIEPLP